MHDLPPTTLNLYEVTFTLSRDPQPNPKTSLPLKPDYPHEVLVAAPTMLEAHAKVLSATHPAMKHYGTLIHITSIRTHRTPFIP